MLFDTHCHLQFSAYKDDADEVYKKCANRGMLLNIVGSQRDTSVRAIEYAEKYPNAYATIGLHPIHLISAEVDEEEIQFKSREEEFDYNTYKKLAEHDKVIAIGECGLELYHLPEGMNAEEAIRIQSVAFVEQYKLAQEMNLPMVIHVRDAHRQMIDLIKTLPGIRGVVHCYTGNWDFAQEYLSLGLYLGFTGVITFPPKKTDPKSQTDLLEAVEKCPMERILIETDAPYLAPQAYRGERCEPWMVEEVAKKIAEIKGLSVDETITQSTENARRLFTRLKP
ncbi:MAG: TatD family hydrolase [Candidatus Magasanikbacteria bacterium]|nr:TatD family hydrolase [Candidatus Magasanikbacteria bacterium]